MEDGEERERWRMGRRGIACIIDCTHLGAYSMTAHCDHGACHKYNTLFTHTHTCTQHKYPHAY